MNEVDQNTKRWLAFAVVLVLLAALSLLNLYQISKIEKEIGQIKSKVGINVVPSISPVPKVSLAPPTTKESIEVTGTIQYQAIEGGCWYIETEVSCPNKEACPLMAGPNYEPVNLPAGLKKAGVRVKFKLELQLDTATTCQIGPAVKILDYQIL